MRTWLAAIIALVAGTAVGAGAAAFQSWHWSWVGLPAGVTVSSRFPSIPISDQPVGPQPKAIVDREKFDFGVMDALSKGKHVFSFKNAGDAPLKLTKGDTSCACTLSSVDHDEILPGASGTVTLEWSAENREGMFRQVATIFTNDPLRPRVTLTVEGRIKGTLSANPAEISLGSIVASESASATTRFYSYLQEPIELTGCQTNDPEYVQASFEPLPAEEVAKEKDATRGWLIQVSVKSGLPVGPFRKRIELRTNVKESPTYGIPVTGVITSEVSVVGPGWDERTGVLRLGNVRADEGTERTLYLRVEGPYHKEVQLQPIQIVPDLFQVRLGKPSEISGGRITLVPLIVEIPKGTRPANYLGPKRDRLGRITIQSNQPHARELNIYIEFSVQG